MSHMVGPLCKSVRHTEGRDVEVWWVFIVSIYKTTGSCVNVFNEKKTSYVTNIKITNDVNSCICLQTYIVAINILKIGRDVTSL